MTQPPSVDLYWSFRSPFSYLALPRVEQMAHELGVQWQVKIVSPLAIRHPEHFSRQRENPLARPYFLRECEREAEYLGMPFRRPIPDPIVQDMDTLAIAVEQPYIHRLTRLGIAASRRDRALPFIVAVSRLLWDGTVDNWHQGDHLEKATATAGLNLVEMEADIQRDPASHDAEIARNESEQRAAGHWGVPLFVYRNEPFWGQDRLDRLAWRIAKDS